MLTVALYLASASAMKVKIEPKGVASPNAATVQLRSITILFIII